MAHQVASDDKKAGQKSTLETCCKGSKDFKKKYEDFLKRVGLPNGRILLDDIEEFGYQEDTGLVLKWKAKYEFKVIGRLVQYDTEISGYKMKEVGGVNSSEWITTTKISIDDRASAEICLKSDIGNNKSFVVPLQGLAGAMKGGK